MTYVCTLVHFLVTFITDHKVFEALDGNGVIEDIRSLNAEALRHYVICKLLLLVLLVFIYSCLIKLLLWAYRCVKERTITTRNECIEARIFKYALPYMVVIMAVLVFKLPEGFLSNDESLIFAEASSLNTYTWFYYLTTYYYIVTIMLIPSWLGPVLVKVALQVTVCGYSVMRAHSYIKSRAAFLMYIPFMLFPVLAYTTSAHRIPIYYLLYILLLFTLLMDSLEKVTPTRRKLFWLLVCAALLTQWRTEGIYMAVLSVIMIVLAYSEYFNRNKKRILALIIASLSIQYLVQAGQNGFIPGQMGAQADNRMGPFWAYTITNMYRNGLDIEANKEDMQKIWRYLDKDTLQAINDDLKDINYEDVLILYYPGYTGKIESAAPEDYAAYVEGCKSIFINNPDVLLRTRWGSFGYAALPYHMNMNAGIAGLLFSVVKGLFYNLYIPCTLGIVLLIYALIKKDWLRFFMLGGLICHWFIVFVLAPASYFKYYLPIYMTVYFLCVFDICRSRLLNRADGK